jgi:hypothetical protein
VRDIIVVRDMIVVLTYDSRLVAKTIELVSFSTKSNDLHLPEEHWCCKPNGVWSLGSTLSTTPLQTSSRCVPQ